MKKAKDENNRVLIEDLDGVDNFDSNNKEVLRSVYADALGDRALLMDLSILSWSIRGMNDN